MIFHVCCGGLLTYAGNSEGAPCVFPFTLRGKVYTECTNDTDVHNRHHNRWCSTTADYEKDKKFGFCPDRGKSKQILRY